MTSSVMTSGLHRQARQPSNPLRAIFTANPAFRGGTLRKLPKWTSSSMAAGRTPSVHVADLRRSRWRQDKQTLRLFHRRADVRVSSSDESEEWWAMSDEIILILAGDLEDFEHECNYRALWPRPVGKPSSLNRYSLSIFSRICSAWQRRSQTGPHRHAPEWT